MAGSCRGFCYHRPHIHNLAPVQGRQGSRCRLGSLSCPLSVGAGDNPRLVRPDSSVNAIYFGRIDRSDGVISTLGISLWRAGTIDLGSGSWSRIDHCETPSEYQAAPLRHREQVRPGDSILTNPARRNEWLSAKSFWKFLLVPYAKRRSASRRTAPALNVKSATVCIPYAMTSP